MLCSENLLLKRGDARQTVDRLSPKPKSVDDLMVVVFSAVRKTVVTKVKMKDQIENKLRGHILYIPTPFCQKASDLGIVTTTSYLGVHALKL